MTVTVAYHCCVRCTYLELGGERCAEPLLRLQLRRELACILPRLLCRRLHVLLATVLE